MAVSSYHRDAVTGKSFLLQPPRTHMLFLLLTTLFPSPSLPFTCTFGYKFLRVELPWQNACDVLSLALLPEGLHQSTLPTDGPRKGQFPSWPTLIIIIL